jgi:hypothetical protein
MIFPESTPVFAFSVTPPGKLVVLLYVIAESPVAASVVLKTAFLATFASVAVVVQVGTVENWIAFDRNGTSELLWNQAV